MRLFLSYRRGDSPFVAGRLKDRMVEAFGEDNVFYDVDSIDPGVDFRDAIAERLNAADAVLAVIGPGWDPSRLQEDTDFVRIELELTLHTGKRLVPILIAPAVMPIAAELPESLKNLPFRNGVPLRPDPDFDTDVSRLLKGLTSSDRDDRHWLWSSTTRVAVLAGVVLAAVIGLVLVIVALSRGDDGGADAAETNVAATSTSTDNSASATVPATTESSDDSPSTTAPGSTDWSGDSLQSGLDQQRWTEQQDRPATTVDWATDGVTVGMRPSAAPHSQAWIRTTCTFASDFAVTVAYEPVTWNQARGQRLGLLAIVDEGTMLALQRNTDGGGSGEGEVDHYLVDFGPGGNPLLTPDSDRPATRASQGELRLTRQAGSYTAQYRDEGDPEWTDIGSGGTSFTGPVSIGISVWSDVGGKTLEVVFRDFVIEAGTCNP